MHASQVLALIVSATSLVAAAPAVIKLRSDDVVLYGKGRYTIMKRTELSELEECRKNGTVPPMPANLNPDLPFHLPGANNTTNGTNSARSLSKRGEETIIIPNPATRFLGWDVQMSQVVQGAPTTISVSSGYSIANTISVGTSVSVSTIESFLSASLSIDYSTSWTSSQTQQFSGEVPAGKYGAFVSNPWTNRNSGNVFTGAIGAEGTLTAYQADSFENKSFDDMSWVDGVISLCTGDEFPLKRCLGDGTM